MKSTKKSLALAVLSLVVCLSMLIGTTFAWFTDSVVSAGNIIKSGNLEISLEWLKGEANPTADDAAWQDASQIAIFDYDNWEPGYTCVRHIKIENEGTLALKYAVAIEATGAVSELADVIDVYYIDPATGPVSDRATFAETNKLGTLTEVLAGMATSAAGNLDRGEKDVITLALKMQETAGNDYENLSIGSSFAVKLFATQNTVEEDSFDEFYDKDATFPVISFGTVADADETITADKIAVTVPEEAGNGEYQLTVDNNNVTTNAKEETVASFDISLTKDGVPVTEQSGVEYSVSVKVGPMLDIVKVLHKGDEISVYDYDAGTGILTFKTASFSPFEVTFIQIPESAEAKTVDANGKTKYYETLGEAFEAAKDGDVINLRGNVVATETIVFDTDAEVTLDMGGFTISGQLNTLFKIADGSLTLKNGAIKNEHAAATETKYSVYISGDAVAKIKDVTIKTTGVGIYMDENARITELNAEVKSVMNANGYCCFDAISLIDNARIDHISGGSYETSITTEYIEAWLNDPAHKYSGIESWTLNLNGDGAYVGEISGGTFLGVFDKANNGTPIHVSYGTVAKISGGYFGFVKMGLTNPYNALYVGTNGNASIGKITGGTFEKGSSKAGFNCDFAGIVEASGCQVQDTGTTVDVKAQFTTSLKNYTLSVVEVVAK